MFFPEIFSRSLLLFKPWLYALPGRSDHPGEWTAPTPRPVFPCSLQGTHYGACSLPFTPFLLCFAHRGTPRTLGITCTEYTLSNRNSKCSEPHSSTTAPPTENSIPLPHFLAADFCPRKLKAPLPPPGRLSQYCPAGLLFETWSGE